MEFSAPQQKFRAEPIVRRNRRLAGCVMLTFALLAGVPAGAQQVAQPAPQADPAAVSGSFSAPFSAYASPEARTQFLRFRDEGAKAATKKGVLELREFYTGIDKGRVERFRALYPVKTSELRIGGVLVDVVEPIQPAGKPRDPRVLINLHGGAFAWGARNGALIESIPVANLSGITVYSVDYRLGPEHVFPAASEDVETVYRALLKDHRPDQIGIYGCSAGGFITGQAVARFIAKGLPLPGAIGMLCAGFVPPDGDSIYTASALMGAPVPKGPPSLANYPYYKGADRSDPMMFPGLHPDYVAKFPPTLLVSGTRDFLLSTTLRTQALLDAAGVETELHVYEGMPHGFFADPEPPESQAVYRVIARWFQHRLPRDRRAH